MKFVIDQNAFTGLADALSGRAKQQGQIDGLKIQAAQDLLVANRDKALEPIRQREAQRNLAIGDLVSAIQGTTPEQAAKMYDYANGQRTNMGFKMNPDGTYAKDEYGAEIIDDTPIDRLSIANDEQWKQGQAILGPMMAMQAYGGDAVDYSKTQGQLNKNAYQADLQQGVMNASDPSQRNAFVSALSGRAYDPYKTDGNGQLVNTGTGEVQQTAVSQAKVGNINSGAQLNQANAGLAIQRASTEQIKRYEIAADIDLKKIQAQKIQAGMDAMEPQQAKLLFTRQVADEYGNTKSVFDSEAYGKFTQFQVQNGIRSDKQAFAMWSGQGGGIANPQAFTNAIANAGVATTQGATGVNPQGQALLNTAAGIGAPVAQQYEPAITAYDQSNAGDWSNGGNPDNVRRIGGMMQQSSGKPLAQMNDAEIEATLANLYNSQAITRMDAANLHKMWVEGGSRAY